MKTIHLIGDSTCQTNTSETYPQAGWGQYLSEFTNLEVKNYAKNGRSSKSFLAEDRFTPVKESIKDGDYLFIQFGHNDQKTDERGTTSDDEYLKYLSIYIDEGIRLGAKPVLLTSICRRHFEENVLLDSHKDYPVQMRKLAKEKNIPLLDIEKVTRNWLTELGDEPSKEYFMVLKPNEYENYKDGVVDNTHLNTKGAKQVALFVSSEIKSNISDLKEYMK